MCKQQPLLFTVSVAACTRKQPSKQRSSGTRWPQWARAGPLRPSWASRPFATGETLVHAAVPDLYKSCTENTFLLVYLFGVWSEDPIRIVLS